MVQILHWRRPTPYEAALLQLLCSVDIPDREIYAEQARVCEVREIDEEEQLGFRIPAGAPRATKGRALSEARFYQGSDWASFMLHAGEGWLRMLEKFVPNPDAKILNWEPPIQSLELRVLAR